MVVAPEGEAARFARRMLEPFNDGVAYRVATPDGVVVVSGDTRVCDEVAASAGVGHLVLTPLIPPPRSDDDVAAFAADVRAGGFAGGLTVGEDLLSVTLG